RLPRLSRELEDLATADQPDLAVGGVRGEWFQACQRCGVLVLLDLEVECQLQQCRHRSEVVQRLVEPTQRGVLVSGGYVGAGARQAVIRLRRRQLCDGTIEISRGLRRALQLHEGASTRQ